MSSSLLLLIYSLYVQDLWTHTDNGTAVRNFTAAAVPPHGVVALLLQDAGDEPAGIFPPCAVWDNVRLRMVLLLISHSVRYCIKFFYVPLLTLEQCSIPFLILAATPKVSTSAYHN